MAEGLDPSLAGKRDQLAAKVAAGNTFGSIADEFIETLNWQARRTDHTKNKWMLNDLAEKLGPSPVTQIKGKMSSRLTGIKKVEV